MNLLNKITKKNEIERLKNNIKVLTERNKDLYDRDLKRQEEYLEKHKNSVKKYKEEITRLKIELEDTIGFLNQEKEAKEELLKQRKKLRTMITKLGGDWKDGK